MRGRLFSLVLLGIAWLFTTPPVRAQALPFAWRARPKVLYRYGYRFGLDPYFQHYYDPNRKMYYDGMPYEYYGMDYADKVLGQRRQPTEPLQGGPSVAMQEAPAAQPAAALTPAADASTGGPMLPAVMPTKSDASGSTVSAALGNRARVVVRVPTADAQVWFDGRLTAQQGTERSFKSPPLDAGGDYSYQIRAHWRQNGQERDEVRTVSPQPGQEVRVDFASPQ